MKIFRYRDTEMPRVQSLADFSLRLCLSVMILLFGGPAVFGQTPQVSPTPVKFARSRTGMVASGSRFAAAAGIEMLERGGNAVDAAVAVCLALMVTDPANTSLGGRAQILLSRRDGRVIPLDGATQAPASVPALKGKEDDRQGFAVTPVPGALAALAEMERKYGRLRWADVLQPAIKLAEDGFVVPPRLAATWESVRVALSKNNCAAQSFLKPDGTAYRAGEVFRQPNLARVLRTLALEGVAEFYRGAIAERIAADVAAHGGFVRPKDLRDYRALPGVAVRSDYRGYRVVSAGGRAWGNTLGEMLNILKHFNLNAAEPDAAGTEIMARIIAQAMADRPQEIGSLKPKANGLPLEKLSSPQFGAQRAALIREQMRLGLPPPSPREAAPDGDTSHISVMDAEGNAVSLTTSIGPSFGARVCTPELGFMYAHSYKMRSNPTPQTRDLTEMTPTIVFRGSRPFLVVGGAGSERIPTAVLQIISRVVDRRQTLEQAFKAPRIFCLQNKLRVHSWLAPPLVETLKGRGFETELVELGVSRHLGLVHAVLYDAGEFYGAADEGDSGTAAGVTATKNRNP
jgi:gamma-glutamyltranspeptidase/glutathione hydrolase